MGCASSKEPVCRNCQVQLTRSYSMQVHHPPERKGDSYHVVALTSTTLGSLKLDPGRQKQINNGNRASIEGCEKRIGGKSVSVKRGKEFSMGLVEARAWSNMIDRKIPKIVPRTPIRTPPGEPETINAWELMAGLEDTSPVHPHSHARSFSFHVAPTLPSNFDRPEKAYASPTSMWIGNSNSNSNSEYDPNLNCNSKSNSEELPPADPIHPMQSGDEKQQATAGNNQSADMEAYKSGKNKVVMYFTSLRGVRKTYEDCCNARAILKGLGVRVDERDVSMHSGYKEELKKLLGEGSNGGGLPRVFVGVKCIGGAEEIRRLHEEGQLEKAVEGCEMAEEGGAEVGVCEACGDIRFVPCETCSGSCKIYHEGEGEGEGDEECDEGEFGFQRCPDCNENGIIRCPICCD